MLNKITITATALLVLMPAISYALPSFAREENISCTDCHNAFPQLNAAGREFKELGYRFPNDPTDPGGLNLDKNFPISAILVSRPYDKMSSGDEKLRALHEVELVVAGHFSDNWSGFFEVEAEDETGFEPEVPMAVLTYHQSPEFNVQFGYASYFFSDPYGLLGDHFRLTRGHVKLIDERYGSADNGTRLRDSRQTLTAFGRIEEKLFYSLGIAGPGKDAEGKNPKSLSGRLAYQFTDQFMLGGFLIDGKTEATNQNFDRMGIDLQFDYEGFRLQGGLFDATDDLFESPGDVSNTGYSLQGMYSFEDAKGNHWLPLARLDSYERNNGNSEYTDLTLNIGLYFRENAKVYLEYWKQLDVPGSSYKDSRVTLQWVLSL